MGAMERVEFPCVSGGEILLLIFLLIWVRAQKVHLLTALTTAGTIALGIVGGQRAESRRGIGEILDIWNWKSIVSLGRWGHEGH